MKNYSNKKLCRDLLNFADNVELSGEHVLSFLRVNAVNEIAAERLVSALRPDVPTRSSAIAMIADRTACSILTLFVVIPTFRPLNKKSVRCQSADPTITADLRPLHNLQSAYLCCTCRLQSHRSRHRVIVDKRAMPFRLVCLV